MKLTMNHGMVVALNNCLTKLEPKGRSELRNHSRALRKLRECCMEAEKFYDNAGNEFEKTKSKEGILEYDEDRFIYVKKAVEKQISSGIQGDLSVGYEDLIEELEKAEKLAEEENKKTKEDELKKEKEKTQEQEKKKENSKE